MHASQVKIQPSTKCDLLQKIAEDLSPIESRAVVKYGDVWDWFPPKLAGMEIRGCQRCNFVLQSTLNCLNLKWQFVER